MTLPTDAITPIPHLGVLHCTGPDTLTFLQGQLSNDFALLRHQQARLAAFLSAKGRMQASFIAVRYGPHDVLLLAHHSILAAVQKRLSMFVLRAKVKIVDASAQWQLHGALGQATSALIEATSGTSAPASPGAWQAFCNADAQTGPSTPDTAADPTTPSAPHAPTWVVTLYPAAGVERALSISPAAMPLPVSVQKTSADMTDEALAQQWEWSEVMSGVATLSAPVVDAFVPQMLNYESIGGVNFKKGCYPGQEVVARSQFRGAIKRRAFLAQGLAPQWPAAGDEIFSVDDTEQPCGTVVQVAQRPGSLASGAPAFDAIVSLKTDVADQSLFIRHAPAGAEATEAENAVNIPFTLSAMPYPILEDI